jgi:hypothetical protein
MLDFIQPWTNKKTTPKVRDGFLATTRGKGVVEDYMIKCNFLINWRISHIRFIEEPRPVTVLDLPGLRVPAAGSVFSP